MFCKNCSYKLKDNSLFCNNCGYAVEFDTLSYDKKENNEEKKNH